MSSGLGLPSAAEGSEARSGVYHRADSKLVSPVTRSQPYNMNNRVNRKQTRAGRVALGHRGEEKGTGTIDGTRDNGKD